MQNKIDLYKCRMACDLFLGAMSNDEHFNIKMDYYKELCDLVKAYEKLVEENEHLLNDKIAAELVAVDYTATLRENEKLKRENLGLKTTNANLKADIEKTYGRLGWDNGYGKRHR